MAIAISRLQPSDLVWFDPIWHYLNTQSGAGADNRRLYNLLFTRQLKGSQSRAGADNMRLFNLLHLTRQLKDSRLKNSDQFDHGGVWRNVLQEVRNFDVMNAAPELQHEFCALWNELCNVARGQVASRMAQMNAVHILSIIRTVYVPLHEGMESAAVVLSSSMDDQDPNLRWPSSYPFCNVHGTAPEADVVVVDPPPSPPSRSHHIIAHN